MDHQPSWANGRGYACFSLAQLTPESPSFHRHCLRYQVPVDSMLDVPGTVSLCKQGIQQSLGPGIQPATMLVRLRASA